MKNKQQLEQAIQAVEAQRGLIGEAAADAAIAALRAQLDETSPRFAGERKLVTVMFADIVGFTQLSEQRDPEEVRALMNACFDRLVPVVNKYEGTVDKFIGDEIMALFGAPKAHERHAELACSAALELFDALAAFNEHNGTSLELHVGLNSGLVIAGGIGSEGRQEYSVMGDPVNLAARLKDSAPRGTIFVGPDVFRLTGHAFHFQALPPLRVKGKAEAVRIHRLQGCKEEDGRRSEKAWRTELIGRDKELAVLGQVLGSWTAGRGSRIAIIGEAGIGKSRLITEVRRRIAPGTIWAEGRALPYTRQHSYQPVIEILARLATAPPDTEGEALKKCLRQELAATTGRDAQQLLPFLARLMQLPLSEEEEEAVKYLSAEALRERLFEAVGQYLCAKSRRAPVVLVWEDLHWADPSSLALIEHLLPLCDQCPLSVLLIFRPHKEERIWQVHEDSLDRFGKGYEVLFLEPLTAAHSAVLMRNFVHVDRIAPEVERKLSEKAEGNPFFLEELLRSLLDQGMLYLDEQIIQGGEALDALQLPGTLQGTIASRIDRLDPVDKHTLQTASVLGRLFQGEVLSALLTKGRQELDVEGALERLIERELLRRRYDDGGQPAGYIFKHAVTHDVAYNSLLRADRRRLHRLAGETIEVLSGDDPADVAETLAHHFEQAGEAEKAVHYLRLAADRAKRVHANEEAIELYRRAVRQGEKLLQAKDHAPWQTLLAGLRENLADILSLTGQYEAARAIFTEALEGLPADDLITHARLRRKLGQGYQAVSRFDVMLENFDQAEQLLLKKENDRTPIWWNEWLDLMLERIFLHYWLDRADIMEALSEKIRADISQNGTPLQQSMFYQNLLLMNFRKEGYLLSEATPQLGRQSVDAAERTGDLLRIGTARFMYGFSLLWHNDLPGSIQLLEASLELAGRTGDIILQTRNLTYLAVAHRRADNLPETAAYARQSLETAQAAKMAEYIGTAHANLGWLAWKEGRLDEAEACGQQAWEYWSKVPNVHSSLVFIWTAAWPQAALYYQRGDFSRSLHAVEEMLQPGRKRLEPELEEAMRRVLAAGQSAGMNELPQKIALALTLAEQYRYL